MTPTAFTARLEGLDVTVGICAIPGQSGNLTGEIQEVLNWAPDLVLATDGGGWFEQLAALGDALGEVILEEIDIDSWPVPEEAELIAERREVLCHALRAVREEGGRRILFCADQGAEQAVTLAAEFLMIAGLSLTESVLLIEGACPGRFAEPEQRVYLESLPEYMTEGALGLPLSGGVLILSRDEDLPGYLIPEGVLRADGLHRLKGGQAVPASRVSGDKFFQDLPDFEAYFGEMTLVESDPVAELRDYIAGKAGGTEGATECCGQISEDVFRSFMPDWS